MEKTALSVDNWKDRLICQLKIRGYSRKTIRAYMFHVGRYLSSGLGFDEFILNLVNEGKSASSVRQAGFAVKFFLRHLCMQETSNLPNVKSDKKLPVILSKGEIDRMILSSYNLIHRLMLQMLYSTGMRVGELIDLKWEDIDFERNIIHIKVAKGRKDRIVMLSSRVKRELKKLPVERKGNLFLSARRKKYNLSTIEKIVSKAAVKAGISKKVTPHALRHAFATHLLEKGVDIRYIKDLLGHSKIETTMIYTKVSNKELCKIKSPLDF